jgi:hypothetical protein
MTGPSASRPGDAVSFQAGSPEAVPAGPRDGERLREVEREIAARRGEHQASPSLDCVALAHLVIGDLLRRS